MPDSSGETNVPVGDWTTGTLKVYHDEKIESLKEYFEQRFADQDKAVQAALLAAKEAVLKAETASNKRFDSVNEFRKTLSDQTNSFLPRVEYQAHHNALVDRVTELNDRLNRSEGQIEKSDITLGKIIAIVGISVTVLGFILSLIVLIANGKV